MLGSASELEQGRGVGGNLREGKGLTGPAQLWSRTRTLEPIFPQTTHLARFWWRHRSRVMGHFHLLKTTDIHTGHQSQISGRERGPVDASPDVS